MSFHYHRYARNRFSRPVLSCSRAEGFQRKSLRCGRQTLTLSNYSHVLSNQFFLNALGNSLAIAAAAFALTIAIGVPFAFCIARLPIGGKAALLALAALPLVLPSFVSAYALVLMFGRAGIVTGAMRIIDAVRVDLRMKGIIMTYTLTLYPYVVLPTTAAFRSVDISIEEAARYRFLRLRMLRTVTLPIMMPSILAGGLLVFIEAMENLAPDELAEDKPILAVETFKLFVGETAANPSSAGVLGVLLIFCTIVALLIQRNVSARRYYATGARRAPPLLAVSRPWRVAGAAFCWTIIAAALVPFVAVIVISFMRFHGPVLHYEFSLDNFAQLLQRSTGRWSIRFSSPISAACVATLIGVPIGYLLVRRRSRVSALARIVATSHLQSPGRCWASALC